MEELHFFETSLSATAFGPIAPQRALYLIRLELLLLNHPTIMMALTKSDRLAGAWDQSCLLRPAAEQADLETAEQRIIKPLF